MNNFIKKKICICTQSHLCRNPRVLKEALTLSAAGYTVIILTAVYSDNLLQQDLELIRNTTIQYRFYSDLRHINLKSITDRFTKKFASLLERTFHINNKSALGYGANRLRNTSAGLHADLYIMHQELATYMGTRLIKKGFRVAFDLEDWYSEDLLPEAQRKRPINLLRESESIALKKGVFCTTTSEALAKKLAEFYSATPPWVIYNVFNSYNFPAEKKFASPLKLFWFSQTIGPGRGLEEFISMLHSIDTCLELHLLGNIENEYKTRLQLSMPGQHKLYLHPMVSADELLHKIAGFDIGLALELTSPPSRNYTITNKFFQYLQAGLPVIASETEGQNEGFEQFKPGFKLSQQPNLNQVTALKNWLNDTAALKLAREKAIATAGVYNWENESNKLLGLLEQAF